MTTQQTTRPSVYEAARTLTEKLAELTGESVEELTEMIDIPFEIARQYRQAHKDVIAETHRLEDTARRLRNKLEAGYGVHESDGLGHQFPFDLARKINEVSSLPHDLTRALAGMERWYSKHVTDPAAQVGIAAALKQFEVAIFAVA